jgi:hypothetical protein
MTFRELKVGAHFCFASVGHQEGIREKVSFRKYRDVSNFGEAGNHDWIKSVGSRETKVIQLPKPN